MTWLCWVVSTVSTVGSGLQRATPHHRTSRGGLAGHLRVLRNRVCVRPRTPLACNSAMRIRIGRGCLVAIVYLPWSFSPTTVPCPCMAHSGECAIESPLEKWLRQSVMGGQGACLPSLHVTSVTKCGNNSTIAWYTIWLIRNPYMGMHSHRFAKRDSGVSGQILLIHSREVDIHLLR